MNEHAQPDEPHADELDRRIQLALRRRFEPPASLDTLAARLRPRPARSARLWPVLALAAAAAAVATLGLWIGKSTGRARGERSPRSIAADAPGDSARTPLLFEPAPPFCRLASAREGAAVDPHEEQSPDLSRLYRDMDACQRGAMADACEEDELQAGYLRGIELRPDAAGILHGPFVSDEWPGAEILTGTSEGQTAMLVVAESSTFDCCVRMKNAESAGLHVFPWRKGDKLLTEITPLSEPRLLPSVE